MNNLNKHIWEGWAVKDFIEAVQPGLDIVMAGESWRKPFKTREDLCKYIADEQPYYKKRIPEVEEYFITRYGL